MLSSKATMHAGYYSVPSDLSTMRKKSRRRRSLTTRTDEHRRAERFREGESMAAKSVAGIAFLVVSGIYAATAASQSCKGPPYGDTPESYEEISRSFEVAGESRPDLLAQILSRQFKQTIKQACMAKFAKGSREPFYRAGLTNHDIDTNSTTQLTVLWFEARNAQLARDTATLPRSGQSTPEHHVYALFFCVNGVNWCRIQGEPHLGPGGTVVESPYTTLADCQNAARLNSGGRSPQADGRTMVAPNTWWECRSKRVDTWEAPQ